MQFYVTLETNTPKLSNQPLIYQICTWETLKLVKTKLCNLVAVLLNFHLFKQTFDRKRKKALYIQTRESSKERRESNNLDGVKIQDSVSTAHVTSTVFRFSLSKGWMDEDNPISKVGREECSGFLCSMGLQLRERSALIGTWDHSVRVAYARPNFLVRPRRYLSWPWSD